MPEIHYYSTALLLFLAIGILPYLIGLVLARLVSGGARGRRLAFEEELRKAEERRSAARARCLELESRISGGTRNGMATGGRGER